jgi:DNA invertase Pin-like site-specific DNA recombinase
MACEKCGYKDENEIEKFGMFFCQVCSKFLPETIEQVQKFASEKMDWRLLNPFRAYYSAERGREQKRGMIQQAEKGNLVTRPPFGYSVEDGKLIPNEKALIVHQIFREFSKGEISLNKLSQKYKLSVNGVKKILTNRTYLGEVKFNGKTYKGNHKAIVEEDLFGRVERGLS